MVANCQTKTSEITIQHRWNKESKRRHHPIHGSRSTDRTKETTHEVLPNRSRKPATHPGISMVRCNATTDRLGKRMAGIRPPAYHTTRSARSTYQNRNGRSK